MTKHDYSNKVRERESTISPTVYCRTTDTIKLLSTKNEMTKMNGNGLTKIVEPDRSRKDDRKLVLVIYRFTSYVPGNGYW